MNTQQDLATGKQLPTIPQGYEPETLEWFDQLGLLWSRTPIGITDCPRPVEHQSQYLAAYVDGEMAFFSEGSQVHLDRGMTNINLTSPEIFEE